MKAHEKVAPRWSGIDVEDFGPYRESIAAALAVRTWSDDALRARLIDAPDTYFDETGFDRPEGMALEVVDKTPDEFVFVVPAKPPEAELWYRYEQISNWWMLAHGFHWWMRREHGDAVDPFLQALDVQIIGRTWTDEPWREALLADPRATLESETGGRFPDTLEVRAVEERDAHVLVLPTDPAQERTEAAAEAHAGLFAMAHTWWQWLIWPRLMRPVDIGQIDRMIK